MKKAFILIAGLFMVFFIIVGGCSVAKINETAKAGKDTGYLQLVGNTDKIVLLMNNAVVHLQFDKDNKPAILELKTGMYDLVILRNKEKIISQKVLISNSVTIEVNVP